MNFSEGYIYCLTNKSTPGVVKCGTTNKDMNAFMSEFNLSSSAHIATPYNLEFAKFVKNIQKVGYNMYTALNTYSRATTMLGSYNDSPDRVKTIFDCIEGVDWINGAVMGSFVVPPPAYEYNAKQPPTYGAFDPFGPSSGPNSANQYTPPGSFGPQQYPPPATLPQPFVMPQQQFMPPPQQQYSPPASAVQPQIPQQSVIVNTAPQQQLSIESIEKTVKRAVKEGKEKSKEAIKKEVERLQKEEKKKKADEDAKAAEEEKKKAQGPEIKGVRGGKLLSLYFTDGQTIRHNINILADGSLHKEDIKSTRMGIYVKKYDAIVCGDVRYLSLSAFAIDHRVSAGLSGKSNAWSECEYKDGKKWKSTNNMQSLADSENTETEEMY